MDTQLFKTLRTDEQNINYFGSTKIQIQKMGGCMTQHRIHQAPMFNLMEEILRDYNIEQLKNQWDPEELKLIDSRLPNNNVNKDDFLKLFPKLNQFSDKTKRSIYAMFKNRQTNSLTKSELIDRLTLVQKVDGPEIMSELVFYAYSYDNLMEKKIMTRDQLELFLRENRPFLLSKNQEEIIRNKIKAQKTINVETFADIFNFYSIQKYKELFELNIHGLEAEVIAEIAKKAPIQNQKKSQVNLVSIEWFRKWQEYLTETKGIRIFYEGKLLQYREIKGFKPESVSNQLLKSKRPGPINNEPLRNMNNIGLRRDLLEFKNFYAIPNAIFVKLRSIYGGGPIYKRSYPDFHQYFVIRVFINKDCKFIPQKIHSQSESNRNLPLRHFLKENMPSNSQYVCYYRYPGKPDWGLIEDLSQPISIVLSHYKIFVCFIQKQRVKSFDLRYNIQEKDGKKFIKMRIKNYGAILNIIERGKLHSAEVIGMTQIDQVILAIQKQEGLLKIYKRAVDKLEAMNPNELQECVKINPIAGLTNVGNSCYINSVVQCIIRTPFFGPYMGKINYKKEQNLKHMLHYAIYDIYEKASRSNKNIDTKHLKDVIDFQFPYLKGFLQEDAQEFLNSVLNKISEEIKVEKKIFTSVALLGRLPDKGTDERSMRNSNNGNQSQNIMNSGNEESVNSKNEKGPVNQKILKFFSGATEISTVCQKCGNKNSREEPFFTYSLSLPEHRQREVYLSLVLLRQKQPKKYGFTIDKKTSVDEVIRLISRKTYISESKLLLTSTFNGELIQIFDGGTIYREIVPFISPNFTFICYEVKSLRDIRFKDMLERNLDHMSIKLEVRQRQFQGKNGKFMPFLMPFIAQVTSRTKWPEIEDQLDWRMSTILAESSLIIETPETPFESMSELSISPKKHLLPRTNSGEFKDHSKSKSQIGPKSNLYAPKTFRKQQQLEKGVILSETKISSKSEREPSSQMNGNGNHHQKGKNPNKKPYKIRLISKYTDLESVCLFCKRRFKQQSSKENGLQRKNSLKKQTYCEQNPATCSFNPLQPLIDQLQFRNRTDIMLIVIDWDENYFAKNPDFSFDSSYSEAKKRAENRKDDLEGILRSNLQIRESLQLTCEKQNCPGKFCERIEKIHIIPNIFILHLKRFRYEDGTLQKLQNNIVYTEILQVRNSYYELYGVVVHQGEGANGGHYYSIVKVDKFWYKCSDTKVQKVQQQGFVDPNAYLLFYKKKDFQPSLICLRF